MSNHQYLVGGLGLAGTHGASQLLEQADCLVTIGSTWWPESFVPQNIPIIQLDGVLENMGTQGAIVLGIQGCITKTIQLWLDGLKTKQLNNKWVETIKATREKWLTELDKEINHQENPISPQRLVHGVEKAINSEAIITLDVGDHVLWFDKVFRGQGQEVLISGTWRTMGFGLPAALAAQLEYPNKQVVALVGDGGLTMSLSEMIVAHERSLPIKVVVFNNKSLAMEKNRMIVAGLNQTGTNLTNPDFVDIATACQWQGYKVSEVKDLDNTIKEAFRSNKPALIDVDVSTPIIAHTKL